MAGVIPTFAAYRNSNIGKVDAAFLAPHQIAQGAVHQRQGLKSARAYLAGLFFIRSTRGFWLAALPLSELLVFIPCWRIARRVNVVIRGRIRKEEAIVKVRKLGPQNGDRGPFEA